MDTLNVIGVHPTVNMIAVAEINFEEENSGPQLLIAGGASTFKALLRDLAQSGIRMGIIVEMGLMHVQVEEAFSEGDKVFYQEGQAIKIGDRVIMPVSAPLAYKKADEE